MYYHSRNTRALVPVFEGWQSGRAEGGGKLESAGEQSESQPQSYQAWSE